MGRCLLLTAVEPCSTPARARAGAARLAVARTGALQEGRACLAEPLHLFGPLRLMAAGGHIDAHRRAVLARGNTVGEFRQFRTRAAFAGEGFLHGGKRLRLARLQAGGIDAEAHVDLFQPRCQQPFEVFCPCGRAAQARLHDGARTVGPVQRQFEIDRALSGPGQFQAQGAGQVLQHGQHAVMAHQRLHHRMAHGKLHRRRQGRQRRLRQAEACVEPLHQPGVAVLGTEPAGQAGAWHIIKLANALKPGPAQRHHRVGIQVERLHRQRCQRGALGAFGHDGAAKLAEAGNGARRRGGAGKACPRRHVQLAETAAHVGHQHGLATKQMGHAGHVQQQAVGRVHGHPRAPAFGPARHAQQAGGILGGLVHSRGQIRHLSRAHRPAARRAAVRGHVPRRCRR
jgi:hypothetical protein